MACLQLRRSQRWHAWLELLRLPNLFTVPGDVIVGWAATGMKGEIPFLAVVASLAFYCAGLLFNDLFDVAIDAKERPRRPLPSGRVSKGAVFGVGCLLSVLALGVSVACGAFAAGASLLGLILFYDVIAKHIPGVGVFVMGMCRGMNVFLGAAMSWTMAEVPISTLALQGAVLFFTLYILIVSIVARNEAVAGARTRLPLRLLPVFMVGFFYLMSIWQGAFEWQVTSLVAGYFLLSVFRQLSIPNRVALYIRGLILLQGLWCFILYPQMEMVWLGVFLSLWVGGWFASRRFAGS